MISKLNLKLKALKLLLNNFIIFEEKFTPNKAARIVEKTLNSAIANAENNFGLEKANLVVSEAFANEGPTMKRFRPRAKGSASPINKRTAHITVAVAEK